MVALRTCELNVLLVIAIFRGTNLTIGGNVSF